MSYQPVSVSDDSDSSARDSHSSPAAPRNRLFYARPVTGISSLQWRNLISSPNNNGIGRSSILPPLSSLPNAVNFSLNSYFQIAWSIVKPNFTLLVLMAFLFLLINSILREISDYFSDSYHRNKKIRHLIEFLILILLSTAIEFPFLAGCFHACFNAIRSSQLPQSSSSSSSSSISTTIHFKWKDFFYYFDKREYRSILPISLSLAAISYLSALHWIFILPSVAMCLVTIFSLPLNVEYQIPALLSLKYSFTIASRIIWHLLIYEFTSLAIILLGILCFGVGVLIALPIVFVSHCILFCHLIGISGVEIVIDEHAAAAAANRANGNFPDRPDENSSSSNFHHRGGVDIESSYAVQVDFHRSRDVTGNLSPQFKAEITIPEFPNEERDNV